MFRNTPQKREIEINGKKNHYLETGEELLRNEADGASYGYSCGETVVISYSSGLQKILNEGQDYFSAYPSIIRKNIMQLVKLFQEGISKGKARPTEV